MSLNVTNILHVTPLELANWISTDLLVNRIPAYSANNTLNIQGDILPMLPTITNNISLATEFYAIVVGASPTLTTVRNAVDGGLTKDMAESLSKKKEMLYRAIQTLESNRETLSRMITCMNDINRMSPKFGGQ